VAAWQRLRALFFAWYEEIGQQIKQAGVLHADETGWRLSGKIVWLWCFSSATATCYMVDRSRGSPAWSTFFKEVFDGILITDFWSACNAVIRAAFALFDKGVEERPARFSGRIAQIRRLGAIVPRSILANREWGTSLKLIRSCVSFLAKRLPEAR